MRILHKSAGSDSRRIEAPFSPSDRQPVAFHSVFRLYDQAGTVGAIELAPRVSREPKPASRCAKVMATAAFHRCRETVDV